MSNRPERLVSVALDRLHQLQMDNLTLSTQRDALLKALKKARAEFDGLPRSLGYDFTHLPEIDATINAVEGEK